MQQVAEEEDALVVKGYDEYDQLIVDCNDLLADIENEIVTISMQKFSNVHDIVSWKALIAGCVGSGRYEAAIKPNDSTFLAVLSSCGHVGALAEALHHLNSKTKDFGITPRVDHLDCMVSLFARKGQTKAAYDFIKKFPGAPNIVVWRCLVSGCVINKDLDLAILAATEILSIDAKDASAHVMLSNIYAGSDMWNEASKVRKLMEEKTMKKETGYSWT